MELEKYGMIITLLKTLSFVDESVIKITNIERCAMRTYDLNYFAVFDVRRLNSPPKTKTSHRVRMSSPTLSSRASKRT